ncbi:MAG: multiprotein bridging factor aMBF1 [Candidatus Thermoplasmatota archaeon]|nr:multiprotein bridging factor aMBF1 [Candidatus Thermoplasmatota archaeon]
MNCELCGREMHRYHEVLIDGVTMKVCDQCAKYGKEVRRATPPVVKATRAQAPAPVSNPLPPPPRRRPVQDIVDDDEPMLDFGKMIKKRREEMGLSQEQLATKLQEKKNLLAKIEREEIKPDKQTARKIEKVLGIRIIEKIQ